jgi:hypothetical protein
MLKCLVLSFTWISNLLLTSYLSCYLYSTSFILFFLHNIELFCSPEIRLLLSRCSFLLLTVLPKRFWFNPYVDAIGKRYQISAETLQQSRTLWSVLGSSVAVSRLNRAPNCWWIPSVGRERTISFPLLFLFWMNFDFAYALIPNQVFVDPFKLSCLI